jgi:hypothetical protein
MEAEEVNIEELLTKKRTLLFKKHQTNIKASVSLLEIIRKEGQIVPCDAHIQGSFKY